MGTREREEQARLERERQEREQQEQQRNSSSAPRALLDNTENETSTTPAIINR